MKKRTCLTCSVFFVLGLLMIVVGVIAGGVIYFSEYTHSARVVEGPPLTAELPPGYQLSAEQRAQVNRAGYPDAFSLLFYGEEAADGTLTTIRYEVWDYFALDRELTFLNGKLQGQQALDVGAVNPVPTTYRPEQFRAFMSLEQVVAAAQLGSYLAIPLEEELVADGEIYVAGGLAFGLKADQLLYIETFIGEAGE
jgi:hypothetical protein